MFINLIITKIINKRNIILNDIPPREYMRNSRLLPLTPLSIRGYAAIAFAKFNDNPTRNALSESAGIIPAKYPAIKRAEDNMKIKKILRYGLLILFLSFIYVQNGLNKIINAGKAA